jgi:nucleotide-binding universal stress UspA family protein
MTDNGTVGADETASVQLIEEYGPAWSPGPFERGSDGPQTILVGVDGSPTALRAGAYAAGLARRQRSRLVVVYIVAPPAWSSVTPGQLAAAQVETIEAMVAELRRPIQELAAEARIPITFIVRRGDAFNEVRRVATELRADLVVVGASESTSHRFIGSVSTRLARAGLWPVTVVP